jgi:hypothetical protein
VRNITGVRTGFYSREITIADYLIAYYKEREGYDIGVLVDTSDNQVGTCFPLASEHLDCGLDPVGRVVGPRKLACELADIDAGDINGGRPSKRRAARDFAA